MGLQPSQVSEIYAKRGSVKFMETRLNDRANNLVERFRRGDWADRNEIMDEIREFNYANPSFAITYDRLGENLKRKLKRELITRQNDGIYVDPKKRRLLEEGDYAHIR